MYLKVGSEPTVYAILLPNQIAHSERSQAKQKQGITIPFPDMLDLLMKAIAMPRNAKQDHARCDLYTVKQNF
ncbi:hypothetical protein RLOatenuis_2360 [Rickettsiales bacterium]|nr:hypothetical protein RLOatenuis_2360 [Rickettsiales bacterium]